jgi:hypothetical protein
MALKAPVDASRDSESNKFRRLIYINTVISQHAKVNKRLCVLVMPLKYPANEIINSFGGRLPSTSKGKAINLSK